MLKLLATLAFSLVQYAAQAFIDRLLRKPRRRSREEVQREVSKAQSAPVSVSGAVVSLRKRAAKRTDGK